MIKYQTMLLPSEPTFPTVRITHPPNRGYQIAHPLAQSIHLASVPMVDVLALALALVLLVHAYRTDLAAHILIQSVTDFPRPFDTKLAEDISDTRTHQIDRSSSLDRIDYSCASASFISSTIGHTLF